MAIRLIGSNPQYAFQRKEGNVLFNNVPNTFYLRLYGVEHVVQDHSGSERKPTAVPPHGLFVLINMHIQSKLL